jgi:hypothetical protein
MLKKPRLNNLQLSYQRNDLTYEAIMTDLMLMGIVPKEVLEAFTGRQIADGLRLPAAAEELENQRNG